MSQEKEENATETTPDGEVKPTAAEQGLHQLGKLNTELASKMRFVETMGMATPEPVVLNRIRLEYLIGIIGEAFGDEWMIAFEIGWAESMLHTMNEAIGTATSQQKQKGLHLVGVDNPSTGS